MIKTILPGLIGGLGLFLYGMRLMGDGLEKAVGDKMKKLLEILTSNRIMGVLVGTGVTAVIQSSSATTVMVVGFVNAGLMTLSQAAGVIMGANIGTTITAQIIVLKLDKLALPAIGIGMLITLLAKKRTHKFIGQIIMGFGILFLGMQIMTDSLIPLKNSKDFANLMFTFSKTPLLGVLIGAIMTGIVQSSSATMGILIALANQGLVTIYIALAIVFGNNIGTTVTALISSIGTSLSAKRTALFHLVFNVIGTIIFLIILPIFVPLVVKTSPVLAKQIANAHTIFNAANTIILFPFVGYLTKLVTKLVPGEDKFIERGPKYLSRAMYSSPTAAIAQANKEVVRMGYVAQEMLDEVIAMMKTNNDKHMKVIEQGEEVINELEQEVIKYLIGLSQFSLSQEQSQKLMALMHAVNDAERIGDLIENIMELAETKINENLPFSEQAMNELDYIYEKVKKICVNAFEALDSDSFIIAYQIIELENEIDDLERDLRAKHILRLNEETCHPSSAVVFVDILSNMERMADHCTNIAYGVLGEIGDI